MRSIIFFFPFGIISVGELEFILGNIRINSGQPGGNRGENKQLEGLEEAPAAVPEGSWAVSRRSYPRS